MTPTKRSVPAHRRGGQPPVDRKARPKGVTLDSWAGRVHVEWDPEAPLTPLGQAAFFIEFLKASGVFDALVADCPLDYTSPMRRTSATCSARQCCRCCPATSAT